MYRQIRKQQVASEINSKKMVKYLTDAAHEAAHEAAYEHMHEPMQSRRASRLFAATDLGYRPYRGSKSLIRVGLGHLHQVAEDSRGL